MTEVERPLGARVYELYLKYRGDFPEESEKDSLARAYRSINLPSEKSDFLLSDMDENKLRKVINRLEKETEGMNEFEKETHYRAYLMPYFSTGIIKQDIDDKRPPKEWWDSCYATIKKKNPDYSDEQVRETCGHLYYHKKITKKIHDYYEMEDALSLKPWLERWRTAHFYAPDLGLAQAATAGKTTSSNINWIGYDEKKLRVSFKEKISKKTGNVYPASVYEYDVEPKFYQYMAGAPSKGEFLWNYLRGRTPGRVIDKPWKMTPGGVGGSIVPYGKIAPRGISARHMKRVQKVFAKEIQRGTKLREVSRVRARKMGAQPKTMTPGQKSLIAKLEKRYRRDFETEDQAPKTYYCPICKENHYYNSEIGKAHLKQATMWKAKEKGKTPLPEPRRKKGKPSSESEKKGLTPKERIRKEVERQAKGIPKGKAPEAREEAVRKLIEQTGYDRERAEAIINKRMGAPGPEGPEKVPKKSTISPEKLHLKKQKIAQKIQKLRDLNLKDYKSANLANLIQLFLNISKGKKPENVARIFLQNYIKIKRDKQLTAEKKAKVLNEIRNIRVQINELYSRQQDFEVSDDKTPVKGHFRQGKWVRQYERMTPEKLKKIIKEIALKKSSPEYEHEYKSSALSKTFPSWEEYVMEWERTQKGIKEGEKAPRKRCSRCGKLTDKRLMTANMCPECYWSHLQAVSLFGADRQQLRRMKSKYRQRLAKSIREKLEQSQDFEIQDVEKKSGFERCVEWMEEKGETEDPEGICYGILKGKKKKKDEEKKKEEKEERSKLEQTIFYSYRKQERENAFKEYLKWNPKTKDEKMEKEIFIGMALQNHDHLNNIYNLYKKEKEPDWQKDWDKAKKIAQKYKEAREKYKQYKKGEQNRVQKGLYSHYDFIFDNIHQLCLAQDFEVEDYPVKGHWRTVKGKKYWVREHTRGEGTHLERAKKGAKKKEETEAEKRAKEENKKFQTAYERDQTLHQIKWHEQIEGSKRTITSLKEQIKNLEKSNLMTAPEQIRERKLNIKDHQREIEELITQLNLDLPYKFHFGDSKLSLSNRSKYKKENIEWLKKVRDEYLKIPPRFRDYGSATIRLIHQCYGRTGLFGRPKEVGGLCNNYNNKISVTTNRKHRILYGGGSVIAHEMGHNVFFRMVESFHMTPRDPGLYEKWKTIYEKYKNQFKSTGDAYAATNEGECFAEAFMEYATGQIWYNRQITNKMRSGKLGEIKEPKLPKTIDENIWGMLDDYPDIKDYFEKVLGPRGVA